MSKNALGRGLSELGLDVLLSGNARSDLKEMVHLSVASIDTDPLQPRQDFDEEMLQELAASIRAHGVIQPIIVTPHEDRYIIVAGERRFRASLLAGLREIPVWVRVLTPQQRHIFSLIENIQRVDLNPIEQAHSMQRLLSEHNLTQQHLSEALGSSRSQVANLLRLLTLEETVRDALMQKHIDVGHARTLVGLPEDQQNMMLKIIMHRGLNVRQTEALLREKKKTTVPTIRETCRITHKGSWQNFLVRTQNVALIKALQAVVEQWDKKV